MVESHKGRPTKIEGNPQHPASLGATDVFTQAAILDLYDPDRAQTITYRSEIRAWGKFLSDMVVAAEPEGPAGSGAPVPDRTDHVPVARRVAGNDPARKTRRRSGISGIRSPATAHGCATGSPTNVIYHFDKADVVVSLDSDFLACGPGCVRYQKDFAARRRVTDDRKAMNRFYAIESTPTLTGAKADHRLVLKAGEIEGFARQLSGSLGAGSGSSPAESRVPSPAERRRGEVGGGGRQGSSGAPRAHRWWSPAITSRRRCTRPRTR